MIIIWITKITASIFLIVVWTLTIRYVIRGIKEIREIKRGERK